MKTLLSLLTALLALAIPLRADDAPDPEGAAIKATALDYIEGWYTGDAARMEHALHPELAKRIVITDPQTGRSRLDSMGAMTLVQRVRAGGGTKTPKEKQQKDVTILDRYNNAAMVKVVAGDWVDFSLMAGDLSRLRHLTLGVMSQDVAR
jgi:putative lumazine-binding protein